jgi:chaperone BCS1
MAMAADVTKQFDQGLHFAVGNSLRTGNPILDMFFCLCIPMFIRLVLTHGVADLCQAVVNPFRSFTSWKWRERVIEYAESVGPRQLVFFGGGDNLENTDRNYLLQKAIRLYINEAFPNMEGDMDVNLLVRRKLQTEIQGGASVFGTQHAFCGSFQQLQSFVVARLPKKNMWTLLDPDEGIYFLCQVAQDDALAGGTNQQTPARKTITFKLRAHGLNASKRIDAFVDRAFVWYQDQKRQEQESERQRMFFLAVAPEEGKDKDKKGHCEFKQYPLSDHKSFKSLFFPEKGALLSLVDDFVSHRGKFSIDGFPQKLGLLLDGPPGTGKTSLIKALAHYTGRHIISVNLSKVKTNQELMDLFFDMVFPVRGSDVPLKLKFSEVVFVMEDVDAASSVVYARRSDKDKPDKVPGKVALSRQQSTEAEAAAGAPVGAGGKDCDETTRTKSEELVEQVAEVLANAMSSATGADDSDNDDSGGKKVSFCGPFKSRFYRPEDDLNLAGLLNVIDGVVDAPDRILIMTTNHPEKLDPALIRPGRINKKLHLGPVDVASLCEMVEHYLEIKLTPAQRLALGSRAGRVTPAQVEQCCAEAESLEEFMAAVESA